MTQFDLSEQLEYFDYTEADRQALAELRPLLEKHADGLVSAFYRHLLSFGPTRLLLADPQVKDRLLVKQRAYLLSLAGPVIDDDYLRNRRRIGEVHEQIGLEPRWYLGAYSLYLTLLLPLITDEVADDMARVERAVAAFQKLPERWAALVESFARFSETLLAHERAEEEMVREAFMDDLGAGN